MKIKGQTKCQRPDSFYPKNVRPRFHYDNADLCGSGVKKADGNIKDEASEKSYEYIGGGSD